MELKHTLKGFKWNKSTPGQVFNGIKTHLDWKSFKEPKPGLKYIWQNFLEPNTPEQMILGNKTPGNVFKET